MKKIYFPIISLIIIFLPSCKPTEKGYKAAYDAALGKRQTVTQDIDVDLPLGSFQLADGPELKEIDGENVYVLNENLRPTENGLKLPGQYNVAVGSYKMLTNARSQASDLREEGFKNAFSATNGNDKFYTVVASFETLNEAVDFYKDYKKGKDKSYVGLPDAPVIIFSPTK